ncbi:MAG TPA: ABC transporter substrate-binding protein [Fibrobacteria bacterium]|nr:ABC transporter substrate-binding protein [Fibrobacteria bacterium]HOX51683.1 ABC transporter substrate-binding protein [Fibrobacteria bacterium]
MNGSIDELAAALNMDCEAELALPCPVRVPLERAFDDALERGELKPLRIRLEGHANKGEKAERDLSRARPQELPWLLLTPGVGWLYGRESRERLMDSGAFADVSGWPPDAGSMRSLRDPEGRITVLCANLTVLAVDDALSHGRKRLEAWEDLFHPSWERGVALRGNGRTFCETTLLTLAERFGMDAMDRIRRSVGGFGHPSQMVKALAKPGRETPPAATLPLFFARLLPRREGLRVLWPAEGAIASPVSLFVRRGAPDRVMCLANWLCGKEVADLCAGVGLPSARPGSSWGIPEGEGVLSIGWDAIRSQDLASRLERLQVLFDGAGT